MALDSIDVEHASQLVYLRDKQAEAVAHLVGHHWLMAASGPLTAVLMTELAYHQSRASCPSAGVHSRNPSECRGECQRDVGRALPVPAALANPHVVIDCHLYQVSS